MSKKQWPYPETLENRLGYVDTFYLPEEYKDTWYNSCALLPWVHVYPGGHIFTRVEYKKENPPQIAVYPQIHSPQKINLEIQGDLDAGKRYDDKKYGTKYISAINLPEYLEHSPSGADTVLHLEPYAHRSGYLTGAFYDVKTGVYARNLPLRQVEKNGRPCLELGRSVEPLANVINNRYIAVPTAELCFGPAKLYPDVSPDKQTIIDTQHGNVVLNAISDLQIAPSGPYIQHRANGAVWFYDLDLRHGVALRDVHYIISEQPFADGNIVLYRTPASRYCLNYIQYGRQNIPLLENLSMVRFTHGSHWQKNHSTPIHDITYSVGDDEPQTVPLGLLLDRAKGRQK